ncbi:GntR family transcriptional regulator [Paraburkholderia sp. RL18-103-BIB-C]|uniref:GntR family transcriptional regulator n=1 Tax=unclassified Paraburkholderia TaxID=2615204 RepID=UPI0038B9F768
MTQMTKRSGLQVAANEKLSDPEGVCSIPKLERYRLHDTVLDHLRRFIVEGVLQPGIKLNERELCQTLGISRTPLREALKALEVDGLLEISPNRGASVRKMSELELRDNFELMSGLEGFSGELACERITESEISEIRALHFSMLACRAQNDLTGYYSRNQAVHDKINRAARNEALRKTYISVSRRLQAARFRSNFQIPEWDHAVDDHEEMLKALGARDGKHLGAILRQHLRDKRDAVLQELHTNVTISA